LSTSKIAIRFLKFYRQSDTVYGIHSPFVYEFAKSVLEDRRHYYAFSMIEPLRQMLLLNYEEIEVEDFGAGSKKNNQSRRKVNEIAKTALSPPFQTRMLFRIVNYLKPKTLLELGTSLGISALHQITASQNGKLYTLEGSHNIALQAKKVFYSYEDPVNIELIHGKFEDTLPDVLQSIESLDYAFIDGDHRKEATLTNFEKCLEYSHNESVFVFDVIYWSEGMMEAWEIIKKHPKVTMTIDLFFFGIVFLKKEFVVKQHYKCVPAYWKPWRMGFFTAD